MSGKMLLEVTKSKCARLSKKPLPISASCTSRAGDLEKLTQESVQTLVLPSAYIFAPIATREKSSFSFSSSFS